MDNDWRKQIQHLIDMGEVAVTRLSEAAELDRTTLGKVLKGGDIKLGNFLKLCKALNTTPAKLLEGAEADTPSVAMIGVINESESWVPVSEDAQGQVQIDLAKPELIAIEVQGDSMSPVYRNGDTLICQRHFGPAFDNLIGRDCVVRTKNGKHYIKILKRGTRANRITLKSYNPITDDMEDVALSWAAPVLWVKRAD